MHRAEWAYLADRCLFTSDLTEPFEIKAFYEGGRSESLQFDVITSWDVLEHIRADQLPRIIENIRRHLLPHGLCIFSISTDEEIINGVKLHQTVEDRSWWIDFFEQQGLRPLKDFETYFATQYIRGPKYGAPGSWTAPKTFSQIGSGLIHLLMSQMERDHGQGSGWIF